VTSVPGTEMAIGFSSYGQWYPTYGKWVDLSSNFLHVPLDENPTAVSVPMSPLLLRPVPGTW